MYNDSQIPTLDEFALLAREYSKKRNTKSEDKETSLLQNLYELNYIYGYVKSHVKNLKVFRLMESLEHQTILDVSNICSCLNISLAKIKHSKPKFNNLHPCLKRAVVLETKILNYLSTRQYELENEIFANHLKNIEEIISLF